MFHVKSFSHLEKGGKSCHENGTGNLKVFLTICKYRRDYTWENHRKVRCSCTSCWVHINMCSPKHALQKWNVAYFLLFMKKRCKTVRWKRPWCHSQTNNIRIGPCMNSRSTVVAYKLLNGWGIWDMLDNWKILQHNSLANMQWDKMELHHQKCSTLTCYWLWDRLR